MTAHDQLADARLPRPSRGKQLAQEIFLKTMAAIDLGRVMKSKLSLQGDTLVAAGVAVPLRRPPFVVALGKAANRMALVLDEILDGRIEAGVVVAPVEASKTAKSLRYFVGGHPCPTEESLEGAQAALDLVTSLGPDDLVIFLVSGGGSAIFEKPLDPAVTLTDLVTFNRLLVTGGLPIEQINVLRKHISGVKGGRLAAAAYPARQLTLFVSDVPEGMPSMVASGPTMPDDSTVDACYGIASDHELRFPPSIQRKFEGHSLEETPKLGDPRFQHSRYCCLLGNRDAVDAARAQAEETGFHAEIDGGPWDADYQEVAGRHLAALDNLARRHPGEAVCLVAGGEVICAVTGQGTGGRNQAFVLYAAGLIKGQNYAVLSAGTDGLDGNSPADGAVADGQTISRAQALNLDAGRMLAESDSYRFFRALGDTIETGYTGNNVRDVRLWLHFPD